MNVSFLQMEYTVTESDSIERIAALHDCTVGELMKMNRLGTRMVILVFFLNQLTVSMNIYVV